eukprot:2570667-Rhodomonas_salina.1
MISLSDSTALSTSKCVWSIVNQPKRLPRPSAHILCTNTLRVVSGNVSSSSPPSRPGQAPGEAIKAGDDRYACTKSRTTTRETELSAGLCTL